MKSIAKYTIERELASTALSTIYVAYDARRNRRVAIKVFDLKQEKSSSWDFYSPDVWQARFLYEAKILARMRHRHIINVMEISMPRGGPPFFVMPFLTANLIYEIGQDVISSEAIARLPENQRPKHLRPDRAIAIFAQVVDALAEVHRHGLVHRDVKPENILLTDKINGTVRICDFGMAKSPNTKMSRSGVWMGTLDYMSPEQRESATDADARVDVFSVAALGYRMLTGRLGVGSFAPPIKFAPDMPIAVSDLIMEAMSSEKKDRPRDCGNMFKRLREMKIGLRPANKVITIRVPGK